LEFVSISQTTKTFYHLDSIKGANHSQAKLVANNVNCDYQFKEIDTPQQTSNFECGLHVLINSKCILDFILDQTCQPYNNLLRLLKENCCNLKINESEITPSIGSPTLEAGRLECQQISENKSSLNDNDFYVVKTKKTKRLGDTYDHDYDVECSNRFSTFSLCPELFEDQPRGKVVNNASTKHKRKSKSNKKHDKNKFESDKTFSQTLKDDCNLNDKNIEKNISLNDKRTSHKQRIIASKSIYKLKIISDSHGRNIRDIMEDKCRHHVYSSIKPNGKLHDVLIDAESEALKMTQDDFLLINGGTNDITSNININFIASEIEKVVNKCSNTNIIISALPYRYDKPYLNKLIYQTNNLLKQICNKYYHVNFLPLSTINRDDYTKHGLHLNTFGKLKYCNSLHQLINQVNSYKDGSAFIPVKITPMNFLGNHTLVYKQI